MPLRGLILNAHRSGEASSRKLPQLARRSISEQGSRPDSGRGHGPAQNLNLSSIRRESRDSSPNQEARVDAAALPYPKAPAGTGGVSRSALATGEGPARRPTKWQIANTRSARFIV